MLHTRLVRTNPNEPQSTLEIQILLVGQSLCPERIVRLKSTRYLAIMSAHLIFQEGSPGHSAVNTMTSKLCRQYKLLRPNVIVPLCGPFIFPTFISLTKDQGKHLWPKQHSTCMYSNMVRIIPVYGTRCTSYVHIIRYRSRIYCQACIIVYIGGTIKRGNKKMAFFAWHHLRGQIVARPLFLLHFPIIKT